LFTPHLAMLVALVALPGRGVAEASADDKALATALFRKRAR
jgi:hypothetical protein